MQASISIQPTISPPPIVTHSPVEISRAEPEESENTAFSTHASPLPVKVTFTSTPSPAGMVAPDKLNPITVVALVEIINPASAAVPPEAPEMVKPEISNWNPATGVSFIK